MEWIETTGKTVDEAKQRALEELGIDEGELEYEVTQEPRGGLLGRISGSSAHVRARVRPVSREKPQRGRQRGRRRGGGGRGERGDGGRGRGRSQGKAQQQGRPDRGNGRGKGGGRRRSEPRGDGERTGKQQQGKQQGKQRQGKQTSKSEERSMSDVPVEEQAEMAEEFAQGLVEAFRLDGSAEAHADDERVQVEFKGDDLGVLIGQDGSIMEAVRELVKTALQRQTHGQNARVSIDIGGYNAKRRAALEEFARELADRAIETGRAQALEPMNPPDRKVVHDAVNEIDGVTTESEGEEPRRRVIITPV